MLVSDWIETWLTTWCKARKPSTLDLYRSITSRIIVPDLGPRELADITPEDIQTVLCDQLRAGHGRQAQLTYIILRAALQRAVRTRRLSFNPADGVDKPAHRSQPGRAMDPTEEARYIAAGSGDPYWCAFALMLRGGLRRGEVIALRWCDIDLAAGLIHVRNNAVATKGGLTIGAPKSASGCRSVPVCASLALALRAQRDTLLSRGRAGPERPVVPGANGSLCSPTCLRKHHQSVCARARVGAVTLHGLRHTYATRCHQAGLDVKSLQYILGHASPSLTMGLYTHAQLGYTIAAYKTHCNGL